MTKQCPSIHVEFTTASLTHYRLNMFNGRYSTAWNYLIVASLISMLPCTVLVIVLQH